MTMPDMDQSLGLCDSCSHLAFCISVSKDGSSSRCYHYCTLDGKETTGREVCDRWAKIPCEEVSL